MRNRTYWQPKLLPLMFILRIVPVQDKISRFRINKQCKAPKSCPVFPTGEEISYINKNLLSNSACLLYPDNHSKRLRLVPSIFFNCCQRNRSNAPLCAYNRHIPGRYPVNEKPGQFPCVYSLFFCQVRTKNLFFLPT